MKSVRSEGKYYYRFLCAALLTAVAYATFFFVWFSFVSVHNQTNALTGYGNLVMASVIYVALCGFTMVSLHAYKIGVERKANTLAAQIISLFIVDMTEVLVSMAITGQFRFALHFLWRYSLLFFVQSMLFTVLSIPMINIYRKIFPPLKVLGIEGDNPNDLFDKINAIDYKYHIAERLPYTSDRLEKTILKYDAVLINDVPADVKNRILLFCFANDVRIYVSPEIADIITKSSEQLNLLDTPLYLCRNNGMSFMERIIKRTCDILFSAAALVLFSPLFALTALAIKLDDGGPVFYKQERCTIDCRRFMIIKFRSMIVDAEKDGRPHPAGEKDERITRVGRIIRATRFDEFPQLINILRGEMSIVGPRPERIEHVERYTADLPEFVLRSKVKGGLTGYAQVYGKYNTSASDKLKLDIVYITRYNLLLDLQIIIETLKILFQKESTEGFSSEQSKRMHDETD